MCVFHLLEMTLVVTEMAEIWPMGFRMVYCFCVLLLSEMFYLVTPFKTEERMMYHPCTLHQQGIEALFLEVLELVRLLKPSPSYCQDP